MEAQKEFPQEKELAEKVARLGELNVLLDMDKKDRVVMEEEPETEESSRNGKKRPGCGKKSGIGRLIPWYIACLMCEQQKRTIAGRGNLCYSGRGKEGKKGYEDSRDRYG